MKAYFTVTLFSLMVAVGMSLDLRQVVRRWIDQPLAFWIRVVVTAYLFPPLFAILLTRVLDIPAALQGGLLVLGISPGAPMLTRMVSKKGDGFDSTLAATYQITAALLVPVLVPLWLVVLGRLYHVHAWVPPGQLITQITSMQLLPLALGLAIGHWMPVFSRRIAPWLARFGTILLVGYLVIILFALRTVLLAVGFAAALAAAGFAAACLFFGQFMGASFRDGATLALCNANRHVGLALLISGLNLQGGGKPAMPFFAAYAILAPIVMVAYIQWLRRRQPHPEQSLVA